jgi:hypothetical protein
VEGILLFSIILFCFSLRAYPRIKLKYGMASDSFFHVRHAELIRENNFSIFYELKNSVIKIIYSYPFLYHWLLAVFPNKTRPWAERFTGAFFDSLNVVIIYLFTTWFKTFHQINGPLMAISICFLYAISPALLRFNGGPRSFNGSPRVMAQTLYLIHSFSYYHFSQTGSKLTLALSVISGGLILIGSVFGTQVLFFFTPFFTLLFDPTYLLVVIASFAFILISSRGLVMRVLRGHFRGVQFLAERISQQSPWQNNLRGYLYNMREFIKSSLRLNFKKAATCFHDENYPLHNFLFYYPSFLIVLNFTYFSEHRFLYVGLIAAISLYIFTSFKKFKFLGEPIRYLDYVLVPSYILSFIFLFNISSLWIFYVFIFYSGISSFYFLKQFFKRYASIDSDYKDLENRFRELDSLEKGNLFAFNSNSHLSFYFTKMPIVNALIGNLDVDLFSKADSDLVIGNYPYPGKDFDHILSRFNVKYIVLNEGELMHYSTKILDDPDLFYKRTARLFETKTAIFLKVV